MMVRNPGSDVMGEFIFYDVIVFLVFLFFLFFWV